MKGGTPGPFTREDGVADEPMLPVPMPLAPAPLEVPVPVVAPRPLDEPVEPVALVELEPVVLLWVVVSVCGEFLFFFMSPRAIAEPLARATIVVKTNAGASLRIWVSFIDKGW